MGFKIPQNTQATQQKPLAQPKTGLRPDFRVCTAIKNGEKTHWTQIGAGWTTEKGNMSIKLSALPLGDTLMLFPNNDETERAAF